MPFPSATTITLSISLFDNGDYLFKAVLPGNTTYAIRMPEDDIMPKYNDQTVRFLMLLDYDSSDPGLKIAVVEKTGAYSLTNAFVSDFKPYTFVMNIYNGLSERIFLFSKAPTEGIPNDKLNSRGLNYLSKLSSSDKNNTGHMVLRTKTNGSKNYPLKPPTREYLDGWCLTGKFPNPGDSKATYLTVNPYTDGIKYGYRPGIEWISGTQVQDYGFRSEAHGYTLLDISSINFGTYYANNVSYLSLNFADSSDLSQGIYIGSNTSLDWDANIYFVSPEVTLSQVNLYNLYVYVNSWTSYWQPGTINQLNRSSTNPPDGNPVYGESAHKNFGALSPYYYGPY